MNFSHRVDTPEGPYVQVNPPPCHSFVETHNVVLLTCWFEHWTFLFLQGMPSKVLCNQLTVMSQALQQAARIISTSELEAEDAAASKRACQDYHGHCRGDHRRALQRGQDIEARKEFIENERKAIVGGVCGRGFRGM